MLAHSDPRSSVRALFLSYFVEYVYRQIHWLAHAIAISENPTKWWETIEVNIRGTYDFV